MGIPWHSISVVAVYLFAYLLAIIAFCAFRGLGDGVALKTDINIKRIFCYKCSLILLD